MRVFVLLMFCCLPWVVFSQQVPEQLEQLAHVNEQENENDHYLQELEMLVKHKLDLNKVNETELTQLGMLSPLQVDNFIIYRKLLGSLFSIYELQAIPGWDVATIHKVLPYVSINVVVDVKTFRKRFTSGVHSIVIRISQMGERSRGFINSIYKGSPLRLYIRHRYQYKDLLQLGILGEKDAGEQFFGGSQKTGFDFYSMHLFARKIGSVNAIALGDFNVNLGQGLIHWQGLSFRYGMEGVKRQSAVLRPYNSAGEYNFHRGLGITIQKKKIQSTLFFSRVKQSANLKFDSTLNSQVITSVNTSGYHRTEGEMTDRKNISLFTLGANLSYRNNTLQIGANSVHYRYSLPVKRSNQLTNLFAMSGRHWRNHSIDYGFTIRNVHFFGEVAVDGKLSFALLNGVLVSLAPRMDMSVLYRNISKKYQSIYGSAHTQNTMPENERGLCASMVIRPGVKWRITTELDVFRFPWVRHLVDAPSGGFQSKLHATLSLSKKITAVWSMHYSRKEQNSKYVSSYMNNVTVLHKRNFRFEFRYMMEGGVTVLSRVDMTSVYEERNDKREGFLGFFNIKYAPLMKPFSIDLRLQHFDTEDYDSRLYAYENDVLYYHSIPAFYDEGSRVYININYDITRNISFWLKGSRTIYNRLSETGTGNDEIPGSKRSELRLQARIIF